jgi:integrase
MDQLGHADAGFTLRVYRHAMRRTPNELAQSEARSRRSIEAY